MDIDAIVVRAAARPQRQYSASANGPKYSAVIGEDEIHHAHRLTSVIKGNVAGNDARATETDR